MGIRRTKKRGGGCRCGGGLLGKLLRGGYEYSRRATRARRHRLKSRIVANRRPLPHRRRRRRRARKHPDHIHESRRRHRRRRRRRKTAGRRRR